MQSRYQLRFDQIIAAIGGGVSVGITVLLISTSVTVICSEKGTSKQFMFMLCTMVLIALSALT
jgi:hypothetical protein